MLESVFEHKRRSHCFRNELGNFKEDQVELSVVDHVVRNVKGSYWFGNNIVVIEILRDS